MSEDKGEIEIPLDDLQTPPAGEVKVEGAEPEKKIVPPEEGLEVLKAQLEAEKTARQQDQARAQTAEAEARRSAEEAAKAKGDVQDTNVQLVTTALETLKHQATAAKAKLSENMAAQDYDAVAEAQDELANIAARRQTLENGLEQLKAQPKPKPAQSTDVVERFASTLTAPSAAWVRAHPQYVTDPSLNKKMLAAHYSVADGIPVDSPQYFESIETTLGLRQREEDQTQEALSGASQPTQRRQSPPSAPVSRGGNGNGSGPTTITLTADQRDMAYATFPDLLPRDAEKAYAKNMMELKREGRLN